MTSPLATPPSRFARTLLSPRTLSRRALGAAALAVVAGLGLAGCSTGPVGAQDAGTAPAATAGYPVTIKHAFGETTLEHQPRRVVTVSWVNDDVALALGVVPVGLPKNDWGGNSRASTPWKDTALERLGAGAGSANAPTQYSEADGINFAEIAKLNPDVILGAYSGLSEEDYRKLSDIAPVVAQPGVAYGTAWQDSTAMIGKALGKEAEAADLVAKTEATVRDKAAAYPQLAGKTFIYGNLEPAKSDGVNIYTANDNRPRFLSSLGMTLATVVAGNTKDSKEFFIPWSAEKANELDSDLFVTWIPDAKTADSIRQHPLLGQIPAIRKGALVADPDNTLTLSISAASPLSLPWALDRFLPQLAAAADTAAAAK